jgi:hypothetical protein
MGNPGDQALAAVILGMRSRVARFSRVTDHRIAIRDLNEQTKAYQVAMHGATVHPAAINGCRIHT